MKEFLGFMLSNPLLLGIAIIIAVLFGILLYLTAPRIHYNRIADFMGDNYEKMTEAINDKRALKNARHHTRTIEIKMSRIDSIELKYIERSNIRHYVPFFNFYVLMGCCLIIFTFAFIEIYKILLSVVAAAAIAGLFAGVPFVILDLWGKYNTERIRRMLSNFVSILKGWCIVKEDIVYAFEKSLKSGLQEPLRTYVQDVVIQVRRGLDPQEALQILRLKVDSSQFRSFIINIEQTLKSRGNILALLTVIEKQFSRMEKERAKRKISNRSYKVWIYIAAISVLAVGYMFLKTNPNVFTFYLNTPAGKVLIALFACLYFSAFLLSFRITDFNY